MNLYTRTGDAGQTSIIGGRIDKDDVRVEAYGTVDEVNSFIGQAMTELDPALFKDVLEDLEKIQHELFDCGGDLSNITPNKKTKLNLESITYLEKRIDAFVEEAPELQRFILPGGTKGAASLHIARTITRRAERLVVRLGKVEKQGTEIPMKFLNRLSDYLFAVARVINFRSQVKDVEYIRSANVFKPKKDRKNEQ